jgi:hypothetical protein
MTQTNFILRLSSQRVALAAARVARGAGLAALMSAATAVLAQNPVVPNAAAPAPETHMSTPDGYTAHHTVDVGGRIANTYGSGAMYDTLVNLQSGPRVNGESFEMHALSTNKHPLADDLSAVGSGFGGDPYNFARLNFSKSKLYEFSGIFRRDRQYFDYDLLGNPGIPSGYSIPISGSTTPYAWPQVNQSPFLFNTVRRMTDTSLTLLPLSKLTYRLGYSQNVMQGPSLTPSGYQIGGSNAVILEEMQRNSSDDFTAGADWKPVRGTKLTLEEQIDHYKGDSYFNMAPQYLTVQESDGTRVALLTSYQNFLPYGYSSKTGAFAPSSVCNASIANPATILYASPNGGAPIIDPACNVISSYVRYQPTREIFPTEIFRLQSSTIKNVEMNGDLRYTHANMNLPNYYESFQGLDGANRELSGAAAASARREVMAFDYGIVWQATKIVSVEDQITYSNVRQPGTAVETGGTTVTVPTTVGQETINNTNLTSTAVTTGNAPSLPTEGGPGIASPLAAYFGQKFATNDLTVSWDATPRATFSFTYRYQDHLIAEGQGTAAHNIPIPANNTASGEVTIHQNGGIFNAALRPTKNWELNGSVEAMYNDNAFTPMGFRQLRHYRVHTIYRPKTWATVSGAFNDLERHNNTNNNQNFAGNTAPYFGPLDHVDHSRVVSLGTELFPNDRFGFNFNYAYSDVYMADNICFQGAASVLPGGTVAPAAANSSGTLCGPVAAGHGANNVLFLGRDFEDAPTQYASAALALSPNQKLHSNLGYRVSAVNGSRFFTDAGDVNGSMVSAYQTPFVNVAWTMHPGLIWKGQYDYYGYGEGGQSGAQYCNDNPALAVGSTSAPVVACSTLPNTAMSSGTPAYGFTAPRNFHANNLTMGVHYEF